MIRFISVFLLSLMLMSFFSVEEKDVKAEVKGVVMRQGVYCGGAEPDPEELKMIETPKPWANKKLYVKKGKENDLSADAVLEFTTDKEGKFSIELPVGDYCIVDEFKMKKSNKADLFRQFKKKKDLDVDATKKCLDTYFKTPDFVFTVKDGSNKLDILFKDRCDWQGPPCSPDKQDPPP